MYNFTREIRRTHKSGIAVVGGGVAGCAAAIAAAREGADVILVEQSGILGGQAGLGIVTPLSSTRSRSGEKFEGLVREICDEVRKYASEYCVVPGHAGDTLAAPHILKYVLLRLCADSGVRILFHTSLIGVDTGEGRVKRLILSEKSTLSTLESEYFIDATGDGDLIFLSGDDYSLGSEPGVLSSLVEGGLDKVHYTGGREYQGYEKSEKVLQPVSVFFTMGGVDFKTASSWNNRNLTYQDLGLTSEEFGKLPYANSHGFEQTCGDKLPLPQGRILVSRGVRDDMAVVNMSRVIGIDGSDADSLDRGEILAQTQVMNLVDFLKRFVAGFENAYLVESASTLGIRETRRLVGKYVLTGGDVIHCRRFDDAIARGSYMIDIHDPKGKSKAIGGELSGDYYEIPLRSLESAKFSNLYAAGRCISADHVAHSSTRIQGTCIMTGEAAGRDAAKRLMK